MEIDFVVTWVDMDDPKWKEDFAKYSGKIDNKKNEVSEARFRDYGFLKLHKIPNLAEHFVYFNDDFFIINHIEKERFFKNGLPNDIAAFRVNMGMSLWSKCLKNNIEVINRHFDKKEVMKRDHDKWYDESYGSRGRLTKLLSFYDEFITLRTPHNAQPYLKSTFEDVWNHAEKELTGMSTNRFRSPKDYTQELFRTWQICKSDFNSYNTYQDTKMFPLLFKAKKAVKAIKEQSYKLVCINDNEHIRNYKQTMAEVEQAFDSILPEKSSFEI
ncbi:MAG: hypothetical protein EOO87_07555 [Pedobacter sp.]|nr:MAG: hypothetical protein EOO87_07555 [Pedobacter sp.]